MDVIKEAAVALKPISERNIEVSNGWYEKDIPFPYVKLWYLSGNDDDPSDDDFESETEMIQVTVFAHEDATDLIDEVISLMKKYGFKYKGRDSDSADTEKSIYMHSARFELNKESEE